jgi:hypothetical protein
MSNEDENKAQQKAPEQPALPIKSEEKVKSGQDGNAAAKKHEGLQEKIKIKSEIKENKKWTKGDIINAILAACTFLLFIVGIRSLNLANATFVEAQKEFYIDNKPYLQCSNFAFQVFNVGVAPILRYTIINLGKQPAKIKTGKLYLGYWKAIPKDTFELLKGAGMIDNLINVYVSKESPNQSEFKCVNYLTAGDSILLKAGTDSIYFMGDFEYINEVTKSNMRYTFISKIAYPPAPNYVMMVNENIDITDK